MERKPAVAKKKRKKVKCTEFDAPHFVAQTKSRKPVNRDKREKPRVKKSSATWEFSLEQCVQTENIDHETKDAALQIKRLGEETFQSRKSSRLKSRRKRNTLDLCCPICRKNFTQSRYLVSCQRVAFVFVFNAAWT